MPLRVTLFIIACAVAVAVAAPFASRYPGKWPELIIGCVAGVAAFLLTLLFVRWERLRLGDAGAALSTRSVPRFAFGFIFGLLLVALWVLISLVIGGMRWERAPHVSVGAGALALIAYIALACREELAFRGYPLRRLQSAFGVWPAQIVVALLFAAEHRVGGASWTDALIGPGTGSLLFGMAAIATRGLAVPIGIHAAWNFGQWTLGMKSEPGLWIPVSENGHGLAIFVVVVLPATFAFWLYSRRRNASANTVSGR